MINIAKMIKWRMKILVFNWRDLKHPEAGGAELVIFKTMEEFRKKGHEITFFVGGFKDAKKLDDYNGMKIIRSGNRFSTYINAFFYYLFNSKKYDLIYDCVNGVPYWTPLYARKKKVVLFHHVVGKIFFKEMLFPVALLGITAEKIFMPLLYRKERFVVVSEVTKKELSNLGIIKDNITVIYNGLDHKIYKPGKKNKKPRIVFVGRLKKYKRILLLADIFKEIKKRVDAEMFVIGRGEEFEKLKRKVDNEKINDFNILGFAGDTEKLNIMKSSWLAVSTSMKEGWGLTILEANACKVPAVCFDVPGLNEAVLNGKTGFLVRDKDESVEKCIKILEDKKLREKLSDNALEWSKKFSWENTARKSLELINRL